MNASTPENISCTASSCCYNHQDKCTAPKVDVGNRNSHNSCETECTTFKPKNS